MVVVVAIGLTRPALRHVDDLPDAEPVAPAPAEAVPADPTVEPGPAEVTVEPAPATSETASVPGGDAGAR